MKKLMLVAALLAMAGTASASLWSTPIDNPSFESVEDGGEAGGWGYIIDDWFESETPNEWANFYENGPSIGLVGDGELWAGTETGGKYYQAIGEYDGDETISVTMLIGARWGTSFVTGGVSIYAGGLEADAADAVDLATIAGVSLLDTTTVAIADGTLVSTDVYEVTVNLATGAGATAGDLLWLEISSIEGKNYYDNVRVVPEPITICMLGLGGLGLLRRKRA